MAQVDDEFAVREALAEMTVHQPPAPPDRFGAIRRRAVLHRRRQLAGVAGAVAVLVAAAIAIPLGLLRFGPPSPAAPTRHYHVSVSPPGPHSQHDLIAQGRVDGLRWKVALLPQRGNTGYCFSSSNGSGYGVCVGNPPQLASATGSPASFNTWFSTGATPIAVGTVSDDVTYLRVSMNNGQLLTLYPVGLLGQKYARFVALAVPYPGAVTQVTAYSRRGELGYAVPFTATGEVELSRWLRPGQPALPRPATYAIGSGVENGVAWQERAYIGPWGICLAGAGGGSDCIPVDGSPLEPHQLATTFGLSVGQGNIYYAFGSADSAVSYLVVTTSGHSREKVPVVKAGTFKFFAYASAPGNRVVRWAAYNADGEQLGAGAGYGP